MTENTKETKELSEDINEEAARGFTFFVVGVLFIISISLIFFYSTLRARSIGIATGYLKAVEIGYQTGEYKFKNLPEHSFDTGIYKVNIKSKKLSDENGSISVKVDVEDKFFKVNHYSEELKIIPTLQPQNEN
ncbi:MAG: hypothetical protein U0354_16200 [Candidatus Sericytochromatia bacterium]